LRSVPADAEEEMRKEPEFNFVDGTILYKLVGGCVIGTERWDQIEKKLTDAVLGKGKSPDSFTKIECGGNVKVSGAR
jgi:hypothetical protein